MVTHTSDYAERARRAEKSLFGWQRLTFSVHLRSTRYPRPHLNLPQNLLQHLPDSAHLQYVSLLCLCRMKAMMNRREHAVCCSARKADVARVPTQVIKTNLQLACLQTRLMLHWP